MLQALIDKIVIWLNSFLALKNLDGPSPTMLVQGDDRSDYKVKRIGFGTYIMTYVGTNNTVETRAVPAISSQQSNVFGGYYF